MIFLLFFYNCLEKVLSHARKSRPAVGNISLWYTWKWKDRFAKEESECEQVDNEVSYSEKQRVLVLKTIREVQKWENNDNHTFNYWQLKYYKEL